MNPCFGCRAKCVTKNAQNDMHFRKKKLTAISGGEMSLNYPDQTKSREK